MVRVSCILASCMLVALQLVVSASAYPSLNNYYRNEVRYDPEVVLGMLNRLDNLMQLERKMEIYKDAINSYNDDNTSYKDDISNYVPGSRLYESDKDDITSNKDDMASHNDDNPSYKNGVISAKRALDLGLNRGYSATLQAKHLMGLAAANYAGGPGRRRRDAH